MGQKVNPHGARVGVIYNWSTRWYAGKKDFANNLVEDYKLREMLKEKYYSTGISHIDIERSANRVTINIFTAKPGMIIGRGGAGIEALKKDVEAFLGSPANINIMEIKVPDTNAQLVAENIAQQLEKRISFRRAMKQSIQRAMPRRRQGHEVHRGRPSWAARISPAASTITKGPSRCRPCVRISTTASPKPRPLMAAWASKSGCTRDRSFPSPRKRRSPPIPKEANKLC